MRDGGERSTSGKCLPKSSTCAIDDGKLFSLTLILIVPPEIKKLCILLRFLAFRPQHLVLWAHASIYEEFTIPR